MPELSGRLRRTGQVAILVSRYNEMVTGRLLEGAQCVCREAGVPDREVDTIWVPGAFELGAAAAAAAGTGRYSCIIALGAVIRGDTAHFEFVAGETARSLAEVAVKYAMPVTFGVLTVDSLEQAMARAGGAAGNKGREAAEAALTLADTFVALRAPR